MARFDAALFETIVTTLSDAIYVVQDDRVVFVNRRCAEIFGYGSPESLLGRTFAELYPDRGSVDIVCDVHRRVLAGSEGRVSWGQPSARVDGTPFWMEAEARRVELGGNPAIVGTFHDGTDCKVMGEAMHASQGTLRMLLDAMEDRVYVVSDEYRIVYANRKMQEGLQGDPATQPCYEVCRGLTERCADCSADTVFSSDKPVYKEFFNDLSGRWYSVIEMGITMPGAEGRTKLAVARDITVRKEGEQQIRALSHRLLTAQEEERRHLSRELHDDLGQQLNAVKMGLDALMSHCGRDGCDGAAQARRLAGILEGSIRCIRHLTWGLRPPALERLGLVETVRDHCRQVEELHPLTIDFASAGMQGVTLDQHAEINLFRIVQEALHNVVKHSGATRATVRLLVSHPRLILKVEDNGQGMDGECAAARTGGLGIVGMAERVDLLGGTFAVRSRPGQGTRVTVEIPLQSLAGNDDEDGPKRSGAGEPAGEKKLPARLAARIKGAACVLLSLPALDLVRDLLDYEL